MNELLCMLNYHLIHFNSINSHQQSWSIATRQLQQRSGFGYIMCGRQRSSRTAESHHHGWYSGSTGSANMLDCVSRNMQCRAPLAGKQYTWFAIEHDRWSPNQICHHGLTSGCATEQQCYTIKQTWLLNQMCHDILFKQHRVKQSASNGSTCANNGCWYAVLMNQRQW